jgi:hypothetical protein
MPGAIPSNFADAKLAEREAFDRLREAKGRGLVCGSRRVGSGKSGDPGSIDFFAPQDSAGALDRAAPSLMPSARYRGPPMTLANMRA